MAKAEHQFKIYVEDSDTSERLGGTVYAKSVGHAHQVFQQTSKLKIVDVVQTSTKVVAPATLAVKDRVKMVVKDPHWRD